MVQQGRWPSHDLPGRASSAKKLDCSVRGGMPGGWLRRRE
jgi:hypothetical protein